MKKKIFLLLLLIPFKVYATDAVNISSSSKYTYDGSITTKLSDNNHKSYINIETNKSLVINSETPIKHIYIMYELSPKNGVLTTDNENKTLGSEGFLHEYVNLDKASNTITLKYNEDAKISEIKVYGDGDLPKEVQIWKRETTTDLMIFSTHADDEQLFFAGVMPTYINQGKKVHVTYLARHDIGSYYAPDRMHEQLDGLWALGVTDYPTFGLIPDAYSESLNAAESQASNAGFSRDDIIKFDVIEMRKYKPKVILAHDIEGEYGHGQHRLNTSTLMEAIEKVSNPEYVTEGYDAYTVPKMYIHLYDLENKTVLDYDKPLEKFDGKTAYEISKEGYSKHLSQQYTWFTDWLNGKNNSYTSATQITKYNPAYWGLYKTEVGPDINKNDLFENIVEEKEDTNEEVVPKKEIPKKKEVKKNMWEVLFDDYLIETVLFFTCVILICIAHISKKRKNKKR